MAEAIVSIALETFKDLLVEEGKFLSGVGGEVKALQKQLTEIKCLLKDADRKQQDSDIVRNWMTEIRDLAYRAEDVIASYTVKMSPNINPLQGQLLRRFSRAVSCLSLHQLGHEISDIKSELATVTKSMQAYGISKITEGAAAETSSPNQTWMRKTFPNFEIGDCFVGKEDELKRLGCLVGDDRQHRVISVWGMGGLGKTTIAKKVYNQMIQANRFDCFAWVCITQQCQIQKVLEGVLKQLDPQKREGVSSLNEEQLMEQLWQMQREKRCLIVVDDLWEISHWNGFKHAFLVQNLKTKILVTTRKQKVAAIGFPVELGLLNVDEAWELLKNKSFSHVQNPDSESQESLHKIGKEMVQKCGYLPLAISLLGGVLSNKNSVMEWELVNKNIKSFMYRGEGVGHDSNDNPIEQVLYLSYQDLPHFLKPCFLFLVRWREDIDSNYLYRMWISQGMISYEHIRRNEHETLMEIAELYLSELVSRCMVEVEIEVEDGSIPTLKYESCRLHDVVRELCMSVGTNENFGVQIVEFDDGKFSSSLHKALSGKARHLVLQFDRHIQHERDDDLAIAVASKEDTIATACKNLRSLEIRYSLIHGKTGEFPGLDFQKFKMLRSLVIVGFKFRRRKLPRGITSLVHLKFLRLHACELDELPLSISNLTYLDTLHLNVLWNVRIPNVFKKMFRLKHLILPFYDGRNHGNYRIRLDVGAELETLMWFDSSVHELVSIARMENLRRFSAFIRDNQSFSTIINAITTKWRRLVYCVVSIDQGCELTSEEGLTKLKQLFTCPNLYYLRINVRLEKQLAECRSHIITSKVVGLTLVDCLIEDDPMVILGKLPTLKYLWLYSCSFVGKEMTCPTSTFPRLKKLVLSHLPSWREWRIEEGAMPLLSELEIEYCLRFKELPQGLSCISTLRKLKILGMPELGERVLDSGEDFHKVSHVPSIFIAP